MNKEKKEKLLEYWKLIQKVFHFVTKVIMYSVFLLLILVAVIFVMYFIDLKKNSSQGIYKPPLFSAYVIISPSMEPAIKVQDAVVIKRVEATEIENGDVITFTSTDSRYTGVTITHRVVEVIKTTNGEYMYRTKGDNNNTADPTLVSYDNINGKVLLRIPKIGYIQYFLSQAYGWIIVVVLPCLGIVIYDILKLVKLVSPNKKKEAESSSTSSKKKSEVKQGKKSKKK